MKYRKAISILTIVAGLTALAATLTGIIFNNGSSPLEIESIRASQGIAQDIVTLILGIPLLLMSLLLYRKESTKGKFLLAGTLGYFFVTYLFCTVMGMHNIMFFGYVLIMSTSFFALILVTSTFIHVKLYSFFRVEAPVGFVRAYLIISSIVIALLGIKAEPFTTLTVQGLDLGLLLPLAFLSGWLLIRRAFIGYLLASVYTIFLALFMTALTAKVLAMNSIGADVFPEVILIPLTNIIAILCALYLLKNSREPAFDIKTRTLVPKDQNSVPSTSELKIDKRHKFA